MRRMWSCDAPIVNSTSVDSTRPSFLCLHRAVACVGMWREIELYLLVIGIVILPPLRLAMTQELPKLRGYQLGTTQREARALRLPCQPMDSRLHCDAPDSVH